MGEAQSKDEVVSWALKKAKQLLAASDRAGARRVIGWGKSRVGGTRWNELNEWEQKHL